MLKAIVESKCENYEIIQRENLNREAGAFWFYINNIFSKLDFNDRPSSILFTQEEIHQFPMAPKGRKSDSDNPFYPHSYPKGSVSLKRVCDYLEKNRLDQVGFGGRIEREYKRYDSRWRFGYWQKRWSELNIDSFIFFSGACFAVSVDLLIEYSERVKPTKKDLENPNFPWVWERMWGTVPYLLGGRLVHYDGFGADIKITNNRCALIKRLVTSVFRRLKLVRGS